MQEEYKRFYETYNPQPQVEPEPKPEPVVSYSAPVRKSYVAHIVIPIILMVFVIVVQIIFGVFDIVLPGSIDERGNVTGGKHYVSLTLDEVSPTGYRMMSGNTVNGNVYYSFVNGRCLFLVLSRSDAKGSASLKNYKILGKVMPADDTVESMLNKISGDLNLTSTSLTGAAYPFILDHITTHIIIDMAIAALLIITILISFVLLTYGITKTIVNH